MKQFSLRRICLIILAAVFAFTVANIWASANWLKVNTYEYHAPKVKDDIKIIVLSDLHNHEFGSNNKKLAQKVQEQKPDLILLAGDILNSDSPNATVPCELISGLRDIAPVYFALGNHEVEYMDANGTGLIQELEAAGAKVLEEDYVDLEINRTKSRYRGNV